MVGRVTLSVPGMHWASCENAVRSVLEDTEGVARVQLNSLGRQVMVDYDEERVCQDELIDVLIEAGFMANVA